MPRTTTKRALAGRWIHAAGVNFEMASTATKAIVRAATKTRAEAANMIHFEVGAQAARPNAASYVLAPIFARTTAPKVVRNSSQSRHRPLENQSFG